MKTLFMILTVTVTLLPLVMSASGDTDITRRKPLVPTGNVGICSDFRGSDYSPTTWPQFSWTFSGSLNLRYKNFELPLDYSAGRIQPDNASLNVRIGLSPAYNWITLHMGNRYMQLSPLISTYLNYNGIGCEITPGLLRFSAFYGCLNKAVQADLSMEHFRIPQYRRTGYAVKLGIGNVTNHIDLTCFHEEDDSNSVSGNSPYMLTGPVVNNMIGIDFSTDKLRIFSLTGNMVFNSNFHSISGWAVQSSLLLELQNYQSSLTYRLVNQGFESPDIPSPGEDHQEVTLANFILFMQGRLNINLDLSFQKSGTNTRKSFKSYSRSCNLNIGVVFSDQHSINIYAADDEAAPETGVVSRSQNGCVAYHFLMPATASEISASVSFYNSDSPEYHTSLMAGQVNAGIKLLKSKKLSLNGAFGITFNDGNYGLNTGDLTLSGNACYFGEKSSLQLYINYGTTQTESMNGSSDNFREQLTLRSIAGGISLSRSF